MAVTLSLGLYDAGLSPRFTLNLAIVERLDDLLWLLDPEFLLTFLCSGSGVWLLRRSLVGLCTGAVFGEFGEVFVFGVLALFEERQKSSSGAANRPAKNC